jgi:DNA-binding GntR family transcriptional regulator
VTVKLTAEGRALTRARRGTVEGAVAALLESSTDAELDDLRQQLERFAAFLDAERDAR